MRKMTLEAKIEKLKKEAESNGLLDNVLFEELLDTFYNQTELLKRLKDEIDHSELTVMNTYNGATNQYPNKLIATYNATANARANTVDKLSKLVNSFKKPETEIDPLLKIMGGGNE